MAQSSEAPYHEIQVMAPAAAPTPSASPQEPSFRVISLPKKAPSQPQVDQTFCSNVVITSKYTSWNFLPLFLYESFKKLANAYFLLVSAMQCVPAISNTGGLPSNLPVLAFILAVDGVLAIIEDRRRHRADHEANAASCHIIKSTFGGDGSCLKATHESNIAMIHWSDLTVGTIVKLRNRETAPADLLILSIDEPNPSDPTGLCYVETKSLDGETNLKLRQAADATLHFTSTDQVANLKGYLRCEQPNKTIGRFDGTLHLQRQAVKESRTNSGRLSASSSLREELEEQTPISIKNIILRGCQLRNTDWIYGLVVNTGPDTKIMQSAAKPRAKWSSINQTVNKMILLLFLLLVVLCIIAASMQVYWLHKHPGQEQTLMWDPNLLSEWFIGLGSYFLLLYQIIPVSLYVTISMVMFFQAIWMTMDLDMYYEDLDQRMIVRSMGLNEELGQISYVFSDKTGTLTCNIMEFRKCSIHGRKYGTGTTEIGRAALKRKGIVVPEDTPTAANGKPARKIPFVNFQDPALDMALTSAPSGQWSPEAEFFLHLSLCQTVIPETTETSTEVRYSASSPDEQALVCGAKFFGFAFESRGLGVARVRVFNKALLSDPTKESELWEFNILDVFEFTSDRKRMSVIAQYPNGEYWILTKGADNMIYPLLSKSKNTRGFLDQTAEHLETFADDGLRTLTIAKRRLDESEYLAWSLKFKEATGSLEEIEKRKNGLPNLIDELMETMEKDLVLVGATAIEDKLQTHVPRTIANLMQAGIKVWMLTGDKQETAINISYACQLMDNDMKQLIFNCELYPTIDSVRAQLAMALQLPDTNRKALVIDGECLELTVSNDECKADFIKLAMRCEAVVCCRVSPSQKADMVTLVKETNIYARTLAIGDGANDVAMIQRAHVGVGICGQEGMQAVNSSDYAIGQFSFLEKLLLHHGRLNYKRMSILVGYMFYKNILMVLVQYYYMFWTGTSGEKFYAELSFQMYNVVFTALPIIALGVFDVDMPWEVSKHFPELYLVGPRMELFNNWTFLKWVAAAVYEAFVIYVFTLYGYNSFNNAVWSSSMVEYGLVAFSAVVLTVNFKLCLLQMSWTWIFISFWWVGLLMYMPLAQLVSSNMIKIFPVDYGSFQNTLAYPCYWFTLGITVVVTLLRHAAFNCVQHRFFPFPWQVVQEKYVLEKQAKIPDGSTIAAGATERDLEVAAASAGHLQTGETPYVAVPQGIVFQDASNRSETSDEKRESYSRETPPHVVHHRASRQQSGFAFSYDPQTSLAEAYITRHSVASAGSAMSDAEMRSRSSRENSRASDFGDEAPTVRNVVNARTASGQDSMHMISPDTGSPGLFV